MNDEILNDLVERAAQDLVTENEIEQYEGESALCALVYDMGDGAFGYMGAMRALVARAIALNSEEN